MLRTDVKFTIFAEIWKCDKTFGKHNTQTLITVIYDSCVREYLLQDKVIDWYFYNLTHTHFRQTVYDESLSNYIFVT